MKDIKIEESLPILYKYLYQTDKGEYFLNTIDIAIDLDELLEIHTSEEIEKEVRLFTELPATENRIKNQLDPKNIINEIVDYSLK